MNQCYSPPGREWTAADLVAHFGPLPLARVRVQPPPGTATEADVERQEEKGERCCELIDGVLLEKTVGIYESMAAIVVGRYLSAFAEEHGLGAVTGPDGTMRMAPGLILIPDVAFISSARLPGPGKRLKPIPNLVPDLAVEVLSKSNTRQEMKRKLRYYFRVGVRTGMVCGRRQADGASLPQPGQIERAGGAGGS